MKEEVTAVILCGTLKPSNKFSHTRTLCDFFLDYLKEGGVKAELVNLVEFNIKPGTETDEGEGDEWQEVLQKILAADIIIFATPIWWGTHSSLTQRVIERLDALNNEFLETGVSRLANKVGGVLVSGGEDGMQHIVGQIANFLAWNAMTLPPGAIVYYMGEYEKTHDKLLEQFKKDKNLTEMAETAAKNLVSMACLHKEHPMQ